MKRVLLAVLIILVVAAGANADVNFWLTQAGDTNPIASGSTIYLNQGDSINMSLWFSSTDANSVVSALIGYAESTSWGDAAAPLTTPLIAPVNDESTWGSGSSYWPTSNFASGYFYSDPMLGGGYHTTTDAVRPWGLFQGGLFFDDVARSDTRLFDMYFLSLMNPGESVTLTIWDVGTVGQTGIDIWTSCATDMDLAVYRPGYNYTVTIATVPEPGSILMLLAGAGGLAGFAFRRRK